MTTTIVEEMRPLPQENNSSNLEAGTDTLLSAMVQQMSVGHPSAEIRPSTIAGHPLPPIRSSSISSEEDTEIQEEEGRERITIDSDSLPRAKKSSSLPSTVTPFVADSE